MRVAYVADAVDRDTGLLGDFLSKYGATTRYLDRDHITNESVNADLVVLLGSNRSAHHPEHADAVAQETALIRATLSQGTPVIGICYGAQVLARALGGSSQLGTLPECGWTHVDSLDDELCPEGFWAQMHHDIIVPAPSSTVIGYSFAGPQAFIDDSLGARAVGWQFHPELTIATFQRWLAHHYSGSEVADPETVLLDATRHVLSAQDRARALFRNTLHYLGVLPGNKHSDALAGPLQSEAAPTSQPSTEAICVLGYD